MNEWDEHAADWDRDPGPRAYAAEAARSLQRIAEDRGVELAGAHVLDFGCGTGLLTEHLVEAGATVDAHDTSPAMLAVVERKVAERGWTGVRAIEDVADAPGPYDLVVASSVLAFVDDHGATVDGLVGRLGAGGLLVRWDWERDPADTEGIGFTASEIDEALTAAGLADVEVTTAFELDVDDDVVRPLVGHGIRRR